MKVLEKKFTYREFREIQFPDNEPFWYELINGRIVQKQSPTYDHQSLSREISTELVLYNRRTRAGQVWTAPLDVVLDDNNAYHPDLLFVKKERYYILDKKEKIVMGAPDLVVEILSKSTAKDDKGDKKENYEKYGVREYWLVDPVKKSIDVYALIDQRFKLVACLEETGILKSTILEGFEMDVEQLFQEAKLD